MTYATAALATFDNMLASLDHLVGKASAHDAGKALLQARLADDMFPLHMQIRYTTAQVIAALDRLGNVGLTLDESDIASFAEARTRIAQARALVAATDPASWPAADAVIDFDVPNGMGFVMQAHEYCRDWAIPQAYFHLMAVYCILRAQGLAIGKVDYAGHMLGYLKQPATV